MLWHEQIQEERRRWLSSRVSGSTEKIKMTLDGERVAVLPLWVAVHQEVASGLARYTNNNLAISIVLQHTIAY